MNTAKKHYLYTSLLEKIRSDIINGHLKAGDQLPSLDKLADEHEINRLTAKKAIQQLKDEGLVYSLPARGNFVSQDTLPINQNNKDLKKVYILSESIDLSNAGFFHMEALNITRSLLGAKGFQLQLLPFIPANYIKWLSSEDVDGIIYFGKCLNSDNKRQYEQIAPVLYVDPEDIDMTRNCLLIDNFVGGQIAAKHLLENGHAHIAIIKGRDVNCTHQRVEGFESICTSYPSVIIDFYAGDFQAESGYNAVSEMLDTDKLPDAIFCLNDEIASGAILCLKEHNYKIPEDISVLGFDNSRIATMSTPPISSVGISIKALGAQVAYTIQMMAENPTESIIHINMIPQLCKRQTIGLK